LRRRHGLVRRQADQFDLHVLRHQLAHDHGLAQQAAGRHALSQVRRQGQGAGDDPFGVVARHLGLSDRAARRPSRPP
jgi:hypothetical protein